MTKSDVIALLPKVGDILMKKPTTGVTKEKCKVIFVHPSHLWFAAEFGVDADYKFVECFKLPRWNYNPAYNYTPIERKPNLKKINGEAIEPVRKPRKEPIACKIVETGAVFKSIYSCAQALGSGSGHVSDAINCGGTVLGYHIVKV